MLWQLHYCSADKLSRTKQDWLHVEQWDVSIHCYFVLNNSIPHWCKYWQHSYWEKMERWCLCEIYQNLTFFNLKWSKTAIYQMYSFTDTFMNQCPSLVLQMQHHSSATFTLFQLWTWNKSVVNYKTNTTEEKNGKKILIWEVMIWVTY